MSSVSQASSATGGARIIQSVTTGGAHATLAVGQAFSWFEPMLKIKDLTWCHRPALPPGEPGLYNL